MCVTADGHLDIVGDLDLNHGVLLIDNLPDGKDNLVDVLAVDLLAGLKPLRHVIDKLLSHGVS